MTDGQRAFLATGRTATLATVGPSRRPRLVPICYVILGDSIYTPIDEKPKSVADPMALARVRDIGERPEVTVLIDRWSEDWAELAWVRVEGHATVTESDPAVVSALRAKYPQYGSHDLASRPMIRIRIERVTSWGV